MPLRVCQPLAGRGERVVEDAGDADVGERHRRRPAGDRLLEGVLDVIEAFRQHDRPAVDLRIRIGVAGEHGQPAQRQVDLHRAAAGLPAADVGQEAGGQHRRVEQPQERYLRVRRGDHDGGVHLLAAGQRHPGRPAAADPDRADIRPGTDLGAERARRRGQRVADAAHPAAREPPRARLPVDIADVMVQHHVRRAAGPWAGPGADHAGDGQQPAQGVALEVALDQVGDAAGEQPGDVDRAAGVELAQVPQQQPLAPQVAGQPRPEPRRDLPQHRPQDRADAGQVRLIPVVGGGVAGGEFRDLVAALRRVVRQPQIAAVRARGKIRALRENVVTVAGQPQIAD